MKSWDRGHLRLLLFGILLLGLAGAGVWRLGAASGDNPTLSMTAFPASVCAGDPAVNVQISLAGVTNLGAYEWQLAFDPNVVTFVSATNGAFPSDPGLLGSTGRIPSCQAPILPPSQDLEPGNVRFGCATGGPTPPGPTGGGLLSTVTFQPAADGAPNIAFVCAGLGDTLGNDMPIGNVPPCKAAITPTATLGPGETPQPSAPPGGPTATPGGPTATPGGPTATPGGPTATPAGPTPTPTPLPPGYEAVDLAAGCNPVATTYPDATPIETIAAAVGPAGNLDALWEFEGGVWLGYSPAYPQASDLTAKNFLDVVFICVLGPGSFARLIV
jgi:hypothetical protein